MNTQRVHKNNNIALPLKAIKNNHPLEKSKYTDSDSPPLKNEKIRAKLISQVKRKIKSGYYYSEEVLNDLTDAFARVLRET